MSITRSTKALAIGFGVGVFTLVLTMTQPIRISGKVISARTKIPISDAMIVIDSGFPQETTGLYDYVRTDGLGQFTAKARGSVHASAWKSGYAVAADIQLGSVMRWIWREVVIELRELDPGNLVVEKHTEDDFRIGNGFSFVLGGIVNAQSPDADIKLSNSGDAVGIALEAFGQGGIVFHATPKMGDFYNTPEAPESGYAKQVRIGQENSGIYFIRTRDGRHFAKLRLRIAANVPNVIAFWPHWAYQGDGTRKLEIAVGKEYPFPFERFGLKRESLGQTLPH